jgi:hypothetical protein
MSSLPVAQQSTILDSSAHETVCTLGWADFEIAMGI